MNFTKDVEIYAAVAALARTSKVTGIDERLYCELVAARTGIDPDLAKLADTILLDGFFPLLRENHLKILEGD